MTTTPPDNAGLAERLLTEMGRIDAEIVTPWIKAEVGTPEYNEAKDRLFSNYHGLFVILHDILKRDATAVRPSVWMDISTAPKDGTIILIVFEDGEIVSAKNSGKGDDQHNGWWTQDGLDFAYGTNDPVGWLPRSALPPAPTPPKAPTP